MLASLHAKSDLHKAMSAISSPWGLQWCLWLEEFLSAREWRREAVSHRYRRYFDLQLELLEAMKQLQYSDILGLLTLFRAMSRAIVIRLVRGPDC